MARREDKIVINVGGTRHETFKSTLERFPGTRLANLCVSSSDKASDFENEFFFDRHPGIFVQIMNYYRTGKLHCPADVCGSQFEEELAFWGINEANMEPCCWVTYCQHRVTKAALHKVGYPEQEDAKWDRGGLVPLDIEESQNRPQNSSGGCQPKIWALFDDPHSSWAAMAIAVVSLIFILVAIINTCLETHPHFQELDQDIELVTIGNKTEFLESESVSPFAVVEAVCSVWFTFEFLVRFISCPNKLGFIMSLLNIIDFVAILPFYLDVGRVGLSAMTRKVLGLLRVVRYLRLLRIFKLMRHVVPLEVLGHTLRASLPDICFLVPFLAVAAFMFGSLAYYAEDHENNIFNSIPDGAWWAVISLTTIGYGDMYPITWLGKITAALCAAVGVLTLALPVPGMVNNFKIYHSLVKAKQNLHTKT